MPTDDKLLHDATTLPSLDMTPTPHGLVAPKGPPLPEGLKLKATPNGMGVLRLNGVLIKTFAVMPTAWAETETGWRFHTPSHAIDLSWADMRETEFWGRIKLLTQG